jgi:integrase/recombinase XerD
MAAKRKAPKGCFWRGATLWGRFQVKGRDFKFTLRTDDPEVAKRRYAEERRRQVAASHFGDHRRMWADVMAEWAEQIGRNVAARTVQRYVSSLAVLGPHLEGLYLDEVDGELIGGIVKARQAEGVTNATIKRDLGAVSSVLNFSIGEGYREDNPALNRLKRIKERRDPIVLPDHKHIQMVIDGASGLFKEMIKAALKTGARESELIFGRRTHLDHPRKQLTLIGKRNKLRVIELDGWGYEDVFKPLPAALGAAWLFFDEKGQPFRWAANRFRNVVKAVAKQAQKQEQDFRPFRFHHLRHRHAVDWLKAGRSIYDLQHRLGHTSVKTTEIYLQYLTPDEARAAMLAGTKAGT